MDLPGLYTSFEPLSPKGDKRTPSLCFKTWRPLSCLPSRSCEGGGEGLAAARSVLRHDKRTPAFPKAGVWITREEIALLSRLHLWLATMANH
jgi:hypothetical protein